eukprot:jgi/Botrbrau1/19132/Bobra.0077s0044.1
MQAAGGTLEWDRGGGTVERDRGGGTVEGLSWWERWEGPLWLNRGDCCGGTDVVGPFRGTAVVGPLRGPSWDPWDRCVPNWPCHCLIRMGGSDDS